MSAELEQALQNSPFNEQNKLSFIGFDACLMATVDVADTFSDMGKYLVASEELEPGNGWYYSGWLRSLAENPAYALCLVVAFALTVIAAGLVA